MILNGFGTEKTLFEAFQWYAGQGYRPINTLLRDTNADYSSNTHYLEITRKLKAALDSYTLETSVIVSRRMRHTDFKTWLKGKTPKKGLLVQDLGFLSTSLNLYSRVNPDATSEAVAVQNETLLLIEAPRGTKHVYLGASTALLNTPENEYEFLIQSGTRMVFQNVFSLFGNTIVTAKIVP